MHNVKRKESMEGADEIHLQPKRIRDKEAKKIYSKKRITISEKT